VTLAPGLEVKPIVGVDAVGEKAREALKLAWTWAQRACQDPLTTGKRAEWGSFSGLSEVQAVIWN
jgi:hypothetical protein